MYPYIETICLIDGKLRNLRFHNRRMNLTRKMIFGSLNFIDLQNCIQISENFRTGKYKVRVLYTQDIIDIQIHKYQIVPIETLKAVEMRQDFTYFYKSSQRQYFATLLNEHNCNDLILMRNRVLTDTTYTNLIFFDGARWFSPKQCLLAGCMRQALLEEGKIELATIRLDDLKSFRSFKRINAMMNFDEAQELPISAIIF